jgi:hypothetical protein
MINVYNIITDNEFCKRVYKGDLECLSISDYIEIQTYIESEYPDINYYKNENVVVPHFTIVIYKDERIFNMIDIYKNSDEYFFIKSYIKLKYSHGTLVEFPRSHKFFMADQIDGLLLFLHDIIDVFLHKKENNIQKILQATYPNDVFNIVYDPEINQLSDYNIDLTIIANNQQRRRIFIMSI